MSIITPKQHQLIDHFLRGVGYKPDATCFQGEADYHPTIHLSRYEVMKGIDAMMSLWNLTDAQQETEPPEKKG